MSKYSFDTVSTVTMRRSRLNMAHRVKTSMRVGDLVPIDILEVLPGDNWKCVEGHLVRLSTAYLRPVMDTAFMDVYSFFVPLRLLYNDYEKVFGNSSPNAYVNEDLGEFPSTLRNSIVSSKTVGDYLGLPVGFDTGSYNEGCPSGLSVLPFRAFALIYDEWFRNQNTVSPMLVQRGETAESEIPNNDPWSPNNYFGKLPKIGKKNDYFTSCLPSPQKGAPVTFSISGEAPVSVEVQQDRVQGFVYAADDNSSHKFRPKWYYGDGIDDGLSSGRRELLSAAGISSLGADLGQGNASPAFTAFDTFTDIDITANGSVDLSKISVANVNDLRFAFQLQKMLEKDARGGGRYREYLLSHYGVRSSDARMQIPEFLGGRRTPLNLQQVAQTSQGTDSSPLGALGGYSQTLGRSGYRKAFEEHGYIITVAAIRYEHSYQQGISRLWARNKREKFYDPLFANIGEQPVMDWQLYGYVSMIVPRDIHATDVWDVFGYNEAWADYRYSPDRVSGEMRSVAENSFDIYHFADNYDSAPVLNKQFTDENATFFRRTTAVGDEADVDDFIVDFYFDCYAYRVMPVRSIPGLIDHH